MAARPGKPLTGSARTLVGGILGGILGTSGMILGGIALERAAGLALPQLLPDLELGFGGPLAGAGILGPDFSLPVHYIHGVLLGMLFAGIVLVAERFQVAPRIPLWSGGLLFGAVVAAVVLALLQRTSNGTLGPGIIGLVVLLHLTFGGLAGLLISSVRIPFPPAAAVGIPT